MDISLPLEGTILEVGSGDGRLTKKLAVFRPVVAIEQDEEFSPQIKGVKWITGNALDIIPTLNFDVVVSNIPYHISEPLLIELIKNKPVKMVLVVGKMFAKKLLDDTMIGAVVRDNYDVYYIRDIPPSSFDPPPKVESALIVLEKKNPTIWLEVYTKSSQKVKNFILKHKSPKREYRKKADQFGEKKLYELTTKEFSDLIKVME